MQRRKRPKGTPSNPFNGGRKPHRSALSPPASVDTHKFHSRDKIPFLIYSLKNRVWLSQFSPNWSTNILNDSKDIITNEQLKIILNSIRDLFSGSNRRLAKSFRNHRREMTQCERLCQQWIEEKDENNPSKTRAGGNKEPYLREQKPLAKIKSKQVRKKRVYKSKKLTEEQRKQRKKTREFREEMTKKTESRRERDAELLEKRKEKRKKKSRISHARQPQKRVKRSEDD